MFVAKQSTAATYTVGPILDSTGAEYAGAVIGDLSLSKNGTEAALAAAAALTYIDNGMYTLALIAGNADTVGTARVRCNKAGYQMPALELQVVEEAVYDALFASGAAGYQVPIWAAANSTVNLSGTTVGTVTNNADKSGYSLTQAFPANFAAAVISAGGVVSADVQAWGGLPVFLTGDGPYPAVVTMELPNGVIKGSSFAAGAIGATQAPLLGTINTATGTTIPATLATLATAANLATVDTVVDAILEDTGTTIPAQIAALNNLSSADVTAAVPTANANADALLARNVAGGSSTGRTVSQAFFALRNRVANVAGTITVYSTDDTTASWTAAATTDPAAELLTAVDPTT